MLGDWRWWFGHGDFRGSPLALVLSAAALAVAGVAALAAKRRPPRLRSEPLPEIRPGPTRGMLLRGFGGLALGLLAVGADRIGLRPLAYPLAIVGLFLLLSYVWSSLLWPIVARLRDRSRSATGDDRGGARTGG